MSTPKICPQCGNTFTNKHKEAVYCSNTCSGAARRRPQPDCLCCGKPTGSPNRLFCSRTCYDNYRIRVRPYCKQCGQQIQAGRSVTTLFCSQECRVAYKRPQPKHCVNCDTWFSGIKYNPRQQKFYANSGMKTCSPKCETEWIKRNPIRKEKISVAFTGEKHPNWQGGKSAINLVVHRGTGWQRIAEKVRDRDKRVCRVCGKTEAENGRKMDVHHITPYHDINDSKKANRMSNLISLCKVCHRTEEHKLAQQQIVLPFAKIAQDTRRSIRSASLAAK